MTMLTNSEGRSSPSPDKTRSNYATGRYVTNKLFRARKNEKQDKEVFPWQSIAAFLLALAHLLIF